MPWRRGNGNTLIQVLRTQPPKSLSASATAAADALPPLPVVCVAWNCSGNVVAVASGRCNSSLLEHHIGHVLTWNTSRSVMNPNSPDVSIDLGVGSCCTSLAFHPQQPSLLAGGTSTGAIYMYCFCIVSVIYCHTFAHMGHVTTCRTAAAAL